MTVFTFWFLPAPPFSVFYLPGSSILNALVPFSVAFPGTEYRQVWRSLALLGWELQGWSWAPSAEAVFLAARSLWAYLESCRNT